MPRDTIFEFRHYTLHPGQRDVLIELFEREFIETQEAVGAHVRATFRNLDDPNRFVWIRSFENMDARLAALNSFYFGPVWQAHRSVANATMVDSDNVLLLRPIIDELPELGAPHPPISTDVGDSLMVATTYFLAPDAEAQFIELFTREVAPTLRENSDLIAAFAAERSPNTFPRLPVRENETVFLTLSRFDPERTHAARSAALRASPEWRALAPEIERLCIAPPETLRLSPTARSALR